MCYRGQSRSREVVLDSIAIWACGPLPWCCWGGKGVAFFSGEIFAGQVMQFSAGFELLGTPQVRAHPRTAGSTHSSAHWGKLRLHVRFPCLLQSWAHFFSSAHRSTFFLPAGLREREVKSHCLYFVDRRCYCCSPVWRWQSHGTEVQATSAGF